MSNAPAVFPTQTPAYPGAPEQQHPYGVSRPGQPNPFLAANLPNPFHDPDAPSKAFPATPVEEPEPDQGEEGEGKTRFGIRQPAHRKRERGFRQWLAVAIGKKRGRSDTDDAPGQSQANSTSNAIRATQVGTFFTSAKQARPQVGEQPVTRPSWALQPGGQPVPVVQLGDSHQLAEEALLAEPVSNGEPPSGLAPPVGVPPLSGRKSLPPGKSPAEGKSPSSGNPPPGRKTSASGKSPSAGKSAAGGTPSGGKSATGGKSAARGKPVAEGVPVAEGKPPLVLKAGKQAPLPVRQRATIPLALPPAQKKQSKPAPPVEPEPVEPEEAGPARPWHPWRPGGVRIAFPTSTGDVLGGDGEQAGAEPEDQQPEKQQPEKQAPPAARPARASDRRNRPWHPRQGELVRDTTDRPARTKGKGKGTTPPSDAEQSTKPGGRAKTARSTPTDQPQPEADQSPTQVLRPVRLSRSDKDKAADAPEGTRNLDRARKAGTEEPSAPVQETETSKREKPTPPVRGTHRRTKAPKRNADGPTAGPERHNGHNTDGPTPRHLSANGSAPITGPEHAPAANGHAPDAEFPTVRGEALTTFRNGFQAEPRRTPVEDTPAPEQTPEPTNREPDEAPPAAPEQEPTPDSTTGSPAPTPGPANDQAPANDEPEHAGNPATSESDPTDDLVTDEPTPAPQSDRSDADLAPESGGGEPSAAPEAARSELGLEPGSAGNEPDPAPETGDDGSGPAPQPSRSNPGPAPKSSGNEPDPAPQPSRANPSPTPKSGGNEPDPAPQPGRGNPDPAPETGDDGSGAAPQPSHSSPTPESGDNRSGAAAQPSRGEPSPAPESGGSEPEPAPEFPMDPSEQAAAGGEESGADRVEHVVSGPAVRVGSSLEIVALGLPVAGYLPLWHHDGRVSHWRLDNPGRVLSRLGRGTVSRTEIDKRRFREVAAVDLASRTMLLMDRYRNSDGGIIGESVELREATEEQAFAAATPTARAELYSWLGETVRAAAERGEYLAVETGGWDVPLRPCVLIMVRPGPEGESFSVVEASPVPEGAPIWVDRQPVATKGQVLASPVTDVALRAAGPLTGFAIDAWGRHPFELGLSFGPNPTLAAEPTG
ncbi:hypothetical protein [Actinokineospora spheciospongiae]|uniref:hypothetical protein n=1 Tax=Actinokineospora spheciospongiae TaxID=909613 RepID=UPI000D7091D8|nr:hypothetical protein [Actinokineospora spheciospongiae]PWW62223.1 hypothetical protein DFQ13_10533 [Actinokineospora spheciospongiae]